ncbi:ubiquitin-conjugating enzyme E2 variant 3 isoform X4 [Ursus americanus]|uniref:ubiquitin-conjugating enzyme E2 variant 3 isoform X4 n=1 Tax=Ursus americanus TaxID=9643 RepID=UPI001E67C955|nr:ubiquitin-conjugating enzyme E2 variant 3 isoform X4 [Ursus americanus]
MEMEFDCEGLRRLLGKYKFRDLTVEELKNVNMFFPHFRYSMDTYVFKDSSQKDLLNFTGTVPVMYQGNTYNIPIRLWILDSHPFAPPICFLKPTANMGISVGKHVDAQGRIYLPYLQNWSHPKSVIVGLIKEMIAKFQEELPLYSLPSSDEARQVDLLAYIAKITEGVSDINSKNWVNHEHKTVNKITVVGGGELGIACTLAISAKVYIISKRVLVWGTWVAQSVKRLPSAQAMISGSWDQALHWAPCSGWSLLLPIPLPLPLLVRSRSLSLIKS